MADASSAVSFCREVASDANEPMLVLRRPESSTRLFSSSLSFWSSRASCSPTGATRSCTDFCCCAASAAARALASACRRVLTSMSSRIVVANVALAMSRVRSITRGSAAVRRDARRLPTNAPMARPMRRVRTGRRAVIPLNLRNGCDSRLRGRSRALRGRIGREWGIPGISREIPGLGGSEPAVSQSAL
ncbi:unannotated protein [freshwater metagenome]|uniref:Unannotated protein n=1 Tax=freshwater metagenome TaxID=449393 RepID=A0A6J6NDK4_9ZZZZ